MIGARIGPQGKVIQGIQEETSTTISIDEDEKPESVALKSLPATRQASMRLWPKSKLSWLSPRRGEIYEGTVRSILDFGAFVEFMPGRDGLLHISEIAWERLDDMAASKLKEGDKVKVKFIEIDKKTGKYRLSMRALMPKPEGYVEREARPRAMETADLAVKVTAVRAATVTADHATTVTADHAHSATAATTITIEKADTH